MRPASVELVQHFRRGGHAEGAQVLELWQPMLAARVQQRVRHWRHHVRQGHAVAFGLVKETGWHEAVEHQQRHAAAHRGAQHHGAGDVRHRHRQAVDITGCDAQNIDHGLHRIRQRIMAEHHPFRAADGAGGVKHHRRCGDAIESLRGERRRAAGLFDIGHRVQIDRARLRSQRLAGCGFAAIGHHQQPGLQVSQDLGQLVGLEHRVQRHEYRAQGHRGVVAVRELRPVWQQHGHPVAGLDAQALQAVLPATGALRQLPETEGLVVEQERRAVGPAAGCVDQFMGDVHAVPPSSRCGAAASGCGSTSIVRGAGAPSRRKSGAARP